MRLLNPLRCSLIPVLFLVAGCAQTGEQRDLPESALEKYSQGENIYEGLENNFSFKATLHNRPVTDHLLEKESKFYDWSVLKVESERKKIDDSRIQETKAFLSFYTPNNGDANLTSKNTIWRIYLTMGSSRYDAKIEKDPRKLTELQALYPYHTRWGYPYVLTFPVPVSQVENSTSELTITGPLGKKTIEFSSATSY